MGWSTNIRRLILLTLIPMMMAATGCTVPENPSAPSYEVSVDIPVARERVTMDEVVADRGEFLEVQSGGALGVDIVQEIERFSVGENLIVSVPATSIEVPVPATSGVFSAETEVNLPADIQIREAQILSGTLRFDVSNTSGRDIVVSVTLPEFSILGQSVAGSVPIPEGGLAVLPLSLDGVSFVPEQAGKLRFVVSGDVGPGGGSGRLGAVLRSETLQLDQVEGSFQNVRVDYATSKKEIAFPDGQFSVGLSEATVDIQIENGLGADSQLDMSVVGRRNDGVAVTLEIPPDQRQIPAGGPALPAVHTITFNQSNSNILDLLNLLPTEIEIGGSILVDDDDARIFRSDEMALTAIFKAPLKLTLGETRIFTDPVEIGIDDQAARNRIRANVGDALVHFAIVNHLPVGIGVKLFLAENPDALLTDPILTIPTNGEILLPAAPTDSGTGLVSDSIVENSQIALTEEEVNVFSQYPLYSRIELRFEGTNGQLVQIVESDFAEVSVRAGFKLLVDKNLVD